MINIKRSFVLLCFFTIILFCMGYKVEAAPNNIRLGGADRYETSVKVSSSLWQQSEYIILVSGEDFPDAICAAPLAKKYDAPILITEKENLNSLTINEIKRLNASKAFIVGGEGVVSSKIENTLKDINLQVTRISGQDRYETSAKVAENISNNGNVVIASGENFPDALSMASIAALKQMPILLTTSNKLPDSVNDYINNNNINMFYVVGGKSVVNDNIINGLSNVKRLGGIDRYDTNFLVVNEFLSDLNFENTYLAVGENFPDALCGSASAAKEGAPIFLTNYNNFKGKSLISSKIDSITNLKVLGGMGVISDSIVNYMISKGKSILGYSTYYYEGDNRSYNSIVNYSNYIDEIATDTYYIDSLGNLSGRVPYNQIEYAQSKNITTYAMISNNFDSDIAKNVLESTSNRQNLIKNIVEALRKNNYKGVNIDIEGLYIYNKENFTSFMSELSSTLHSNGFIVTIAIPAKTWDNPKDNWSGAYDYKKIGELADKVVIMTYDEHWAGGEAGPIASIDWVNKVMEYCKETIPTYKIVLGLAAYAYDWPSNGEKAEAYSINEVQNIASKYGANIKWDAESKSHYFNYTDASGTYHTVWFEDSTSISYKLDTVNNYNLSGISIWRLGLEDSQYWQIIKEKLNR